LFICTRLLFYLKYKDADLSTDALIEHIIRNGDPKKRFGVLYEKIVNGVDTPIEQKYFGSFLDREDAKKLAVHYEGALNKDLTFVGEDC